MSNAWTQTYTGQAFDLLDPDPGTVRLEDISHPLAQTCRYTGHTRRHYSVAEHSVLIARYLLPIYGADIALDGLLHDASEAFVGDISRPVQSALGPDARLELKVLHSRITAAIYKGLGVPDRVPHCSAPVRGADTSILLTERESLMAPPPRDWQIPGDPLPVRIHGWSADVARIEFEYYFHSLMEQLRA